MKRTADNWGNELAMGLYGVKMYDQLLLVWDKEDYLSIYYFCFKSYVDLIMYVSPLFLNLTCLRASVSKIRAIKIVVTAEWYLICS